MLLELYPSDTWEVVPHQVFDKDGYLLDYMDNDHPLISATDVITDLHGNESDMDSKSICQWVVYYKVKKVLKYHQAVGTTTPNDDEETHVIID